MKKLKFREVTQFASGHTAPRDLNLERFDLTQSLVHPVMPGYLPQNRKNFFFFKSQKSRYNFAKP